MSGGAEPILFEAVSTPPAGLSARGMRWLASLALIAAAIPAILFALMGAWPVLGFLGGEVVLVLALVALHRSRSRRAVETVWLAGGRLRLLRRDGGGQEERADLDAYWARVTLHERDGAVPLLTAEARGRRMEIGRFLSDAEKRDLAAALEDALRRYRTPVFDNPQLKD